MSVSRSTLNKSLQVFIVTGFIMYLAFDTLYVDPIKTGIFAGFLFFYTRKKNIQTYLLNSFYTNTNNKIIFK